MDAVTCKLFASICIWLYVIIECSYGVPFNNYLSEDKLVREVEDDDNGQRIREEDLRKLILKKLRFRDVDDVTNKIPLDDIVQLFDTLPEHIEEKRGNINHAFVNKVAALLSGLKASRDLDSPKVRMSSLRFGR